VNGKQWERAGLRRVLGTPLLVFYGLGVIIGAGIYVLVGSVFAAAPWSFILAGRRAANARHWARVGDEPQPAPAR